MEERGDRQLMAEHRTSGIPIALDVDYASKP